jgi:hypothetical protein
MLNPLWRLPGSFVRCAEAIVGAPLTPISYAGVARRTTRRTVAVGATATAAAASAAAASAASIQQQQAAPPRPAAALRPLRPARQRPRPDSRSPSERWSRPCPPKVGETFPHYYWLFGIINK